MIGWNPHQATAIGRWLICGGGQLERFYYSRNMVNGSKPSVTGVLLGIIALFDTYIYMYSYGKKSLTDHLHRSTIPLYRSLYLGSKRSPIQCNDILTP